MTLLSNEHTENLHTVLEVTFFSLDLIGALASAGHHDSKQASHQNADRWILMNLEMENLGRRSINERIFCVSNPWTCQNDHFYH